MIRQRTAMPPRGPFIIKLRELRYSYRGETERTTKWRRGAHVVYLPKSSILSEEWVRATLRQAGVPEDEIAAFLRSSNS